MKRNGPLITLLAGIAVAAVLFLASINATRTGDAAVQPAAGGVPTSAPAERPAGTDTVPEPDPSPANGAPKAVLVTPDGTWAGRLKSGTLALSVKDGKAIAYLCDGRRIEAWLKGTASNGKLALTGANGAALTGTVDKNRAKGRVTVRGNASDFTINAVTKPSGLYRAAANVRGAKIVGGWIVLKDGTQVGLATVDGKLTAPSKVDVTTGRASVGGTPVAAAPADPTR